MQDFSHLFGETDMRPQHEGDAFAPEEHRIPKIPNQVETCGSVFVACSLVLNSFLNRGQRRPLAGLHRRPAFPADLKDNSLTQTASCSCGSGDKVESRAQDPPYT